MKQAFKLFASCLPVKGAKRYLICDIQRSEIFFISEGLFSILTDYEGMFIDLIKESFDHEFDEQIDIDLQSLIDNELGFFTSEPQNFPKLSMNWESPEILSNAIVEVKKNSTHNYENIFEQLNEVGCKFLELRFYDPVNIKEIKNILELTANTKLRNIDLIIHFSPDLTADELKWLLLFFQRVGTILIHSTPAEHVKQDPINYVNFTEQIIVNNDCCGQVTPRFFRISQELFLESQKHNSCLNKKVTIDSAGNLKNCPSLPEFYGNIKDNRLKEIASDSSFTKLWNINKDQIEICKDCEFRYICTDCRAFVNNAGTFGKPSKCSYDPYTATWGF